MEAIYFIGNLTFPYDLWLNHKNLTAFRPKSNSRQIFTLLDIWNLSYNSSRIQICACHSKI